MMKQVPYSSNRHSRLVILYRCRPCYTVRLWLYIIWRWVWHRQSDGPKDTANHIHNSPDQAPSEKTKVWFAARRAKVAVNLPWNTWFTVAGCRLGHVRAAAVELSKRDWFVIIWVGQFLQGAIWYIIAPCFFDEIGACHHRFCQDHRMYFSEYADRWIIVDLLTRISVRYSLARFATILELLGCPRVVTQALLKCCETGQDPKIQSKNAAIGHWIKLRSIG